MNTVYSEILSHGTCGFTFRLGSGAAHSVSPSEGSVQATGQKAGLSSQRVSIIAVGILALHFLRTWRPG